MNSMAGGDLTNGADGGVGERGNSATLIKVDKLRELIGSRIPLPQLVVVGDQSSGKSSVLEGITGFAFPRDAELCTRYATQITCRREDSESVTVTIIPHEDATQDEAARLKRFSRTLAKAVEMDNVKLGEIFREVNRELGISSGRHISDEPDFGNAFSQHLLKIEICSPQQEHFTVIDVPGIFRTETPGLTTESDISLVRSMVMSYMRDSRTIILAIVPANVDPATQEILRLAKQVDPDMKRTMGVLTKPDLAIETTIKQIAIDHVVGKRSDLTLGYYIVKNRGPDDIDISFKEGQRREAAFFSTEPWSVLKQTGRAGNDALKTQVRKLLTDLVKSEFKKLRSEVNQELQALSDKERAMGPPRSDPNAQRAYLGNLCDKFQSITRDALSGSYTKHSQFFSHESRRLITRIVELDEQFSMGVMKHGHTRPFAGKESSSSSTPQEGDMDCPVPVLVRPDKDEWAAPSKKKPKKISRYTQAEERVFSGYEISEPEPGFQFPDKEKKTGVVGDWDTRENQSSPPFTRSMGPPMPLAKVFPIIGKIPMQNASKSLEDNFGAMAYLSNNGENIMQYIRDVYTNSRSADLGTFNGSLLATVFTEQSKNWETITTAYIEIAIRLVEGFLREAIQAVCQDSQVEEELSEVVLRDHVVRCFGRAREHAKDLLKMERGFAPWTLNHYFNDNLSKNQGDRLIDNIRNIAGEPSDPVKTYHPGVSYTLTEAQLQSVGTHNQSNAEHMQEYIHDVLKSFYKVSMKRFIDNVCLHVVHHDLLYAENGPLNVFNFEFVNSLDEDQLEQLTGESNVVNMEREKLARDIGSFRAALDVLKGRL